MSRKDSKLIEVRGPTAEELAEGHIGAGAEIVFVRAEGDRRFTIYAAFMDGGYQQWGQGTPLLGDNVGAVSTWAEGMSAVHAMIRDEDDEDEDENEDLTDEGYVVEQVGDVFTATDPVGDPVEDADTTYETEAEAWAACRQDYVTYRK